MLIGNRKSFAMEIRPLAPSWERRYVPERAAWAALSIWVAGENLCRHETVGADSIEDAVNVPLVPFTDWIVRCWPSLLFEERARVFPTGDDLFSALARWGRVPPPQGVSEDDWIDTREAWWSRHFLSAGAEGAHLPNIALARDDERLLVQWTRPRFPGLGPIFLAAEGLGRIQWNEAEETFVGFVKTVSDWLKSAGLAESYSWAASQNPLQNAYDMSNEALELYTGRDCDELYELTGAQSLHGLRRQLGLAAGVDDPAGSPVTQALRDLPPHLPSPFWEFLSGLDEATKQQGRTGRLSRLRGIAFDAVRSATTPEEAGYLGARSLRSSLGLDGSPVSRIEDLAEEHEVAVITSESQSAARMITGMREGGGAATIVLRSPRTSVRWGRRFEVSRAMGHLLLDPIRSRSLGAAASNFSVGSRRRRSGAFAAELLLPESALRDVSRGVLDRAADPTTFVEILEKFDVGARMAAYQLWNHGLLSSSDVRDDLIGEFGSQEFGAP